jgi:hypothetical protein
MKEREALFAEMRLHFDDSHRHDHQYGNCVVFRHDDGGTMGTTTYLCADGTWTDDRNQAARCLDLKEAELLCQKHNISCFGGVHPQQACCDIMSFRFPEDYEKWARRLDTHDDDPPPSGFYHGVVG